jgi:hypothetical protein
MVNECLKALVEDNKRVIIPDFGGFVVKNSAAGPQISFNNFLKFNDDLLINALMKESDVEKYEAVKIVKDYVKNVEIVLDKEGTFEVAGIGFLVKDKKGNIRFLNKIDRVAESTYATKTEKVKEVKRVLESNPPEEKIATDIVDDTLKKKILPIFLYSLIAVLIVGGVWAVSNNGMLDSIYSTKKSEVSLVVDKEDTGFLDKLSKKRDELVEQIAEEKMNPEEEKEGLWSRIKSKVDGITADKEEKTASSIDDQPKELPAKKDEMVQQSPVKKDVKPVVRVSREEKKLVAEKGENEKLTIEQLVAAREQQQENKAAPSVKKENNLRVNVVYDKNSKSSGKKSYYLIAGCFGVSGNADNFCTELRGKGYKSEILRRYNNLNAVTYGRFDTLEGAKRGWLKMSKTTPDAWILVR